MAHIQFRFMQMHVTTMKLMFNVNNSGRRVRNIVTNNINAESINLISTDKEQRKWYKQLRIKIYQTKKNSLV